MVEDDQSTYAEDDYSYNNALTNGDTIAWNPEGYRTVKHVLVKFDDDQAKQYSELNATLDSLNDELAALDNPEVVEDGAEGAEGDEAEEAEEEKAAPRTREEIQKDIGDIGASIEVLYSQLLPKAQEVVDAFNGGTDIDTLIAQYGEDPGMTQPSYLAEGYAVHKDSVVYDPVFTAGAFSEKMQQPGDTSDPVVGSYGIHILHYLRDIPSGITELTDEISAEIEESLYTDKMNSIYAEALEAWIAEHDIVYHQEAIDALTASAQEPEATAE
jgi:hypothetical protein